MIIITVVLNDENGLLKTCKSLSNIGHLISNHIIIDGLSTDKTLDIARSYKNTASHDVTVLSGSDNGLYDAMNKGCAAIKAENSDNKFVWFLNAGDECCIEDLAVFSDALSSDADILLFKANVVLDKLTIIRPARPAKDFYIFETPVHQAVLFRRTILHSGIFDLDFKVQADTKLIYKLLRSEHTRSIHNIVVCNFYYGGLSSNYTNREKCLSQLVEQLFIMVKYNNKGFIFIFLQTISMIIKYQLSKIFGVTFFSKLHFRIISLKKLL